VKSIWCATRASKSRIGRAWDHHDEDPSAAHRRSAAQVRQHASMSHDERHGADVSPILDVAKVPRSSDRHAIDEQAVRRQDIGSALELVRGRTMAHHKNRMITARALVLFAAIAADGRARDRYRRRIANGSGSVDRGKHGLQFKCVETVADVVPEHTAIARAIAATLPGVRRLSSRFASALGGRRQRDAAVGLYLYNYPST